MDERTVNTTRDAKPPAPPRWRGAQSLNLVHQFNERCIDVLHELAADDALVTMPAVVRANRDLWVGLNDDARRAAARFPFVIADACFADDSWWRETSKKWTGVCINASDQELPSDLAEQLMHEVTMFAWQTARWDRTVAQLSFGMSAGVVDIIAALTPQQIRLIATTQSSVVALRWSDDISFWRDLLAAARANENRKLAELQLHAKLRLSGQIAQVQSRRF